MSNAVYLCARAVGTHLATKNFPFPVKYGPERLKREAVSTTSIVFERDRGNSESFEAPRGQQQNPRKMATRQHGAMATIYARSNVPGAMVQDHEALCDQIVDAVFVGLYRWAKAQQLTTITLTEARYLSAADRNDIETWDGAVYVIRFKVPAGVFDRDYAGDGRPETEVLGFRNTTHARLTGASEADPETGCGSP